VGIFQSRVSTISLHGCGTCGGSNLQDPTEEEDEEEEEEGEEEEEEKKKRRRRRNRRRRKEEKEEKKKTKRRKEEEEEERLRLQNNLSLGSDSVADLYIDIILFPSLKPGRKKLLGPPDGIDARS
jgi:predicted  nucleic acid-binding Zn-ribbon protein